MQIELKEMHKKLGITFIYVTHDQEEALTMSDTIVVMKSGEIQQVGGPLDIYNEPVNAFVADFIGESNIYNATMAGKLKVRFLNHVFDCVDDFPINEKVDVVVRPDMVLANSSTVLRIVLMPLELEALSFMNCAPRSLQKGKRSHREGQSDRRCNAP